MDSFIPYDPSWGDHEKVVAVITAIAAYLPQKQKKKAKEIREENRKYNRMHNSKSKRRIIENAKD